MSITKNQFKKMKQLDKIEYMLREDKIRENMQGCSIINEFNLFIKTFCLFFIIIMVFWIKFPESQQIIYFFWILSFYPKVFGIVIVVVIVYNIYNWFNRNKKLNELDRKFLKRKKEKR